MTTSTAGYDYQITDLLKNSLSFFRLFKYRPNYSFCIETDGYLIKTAEKLWDLYRVFRLRQEAFLMDDQSSPIPFLIDIDAHDLTCDHVVIFDKKNNRICGTYRMQTSLMTSEFYSEGEFDLSRFLRTPFIKLELGRACIHPDYRNGNIIDLLWRGIGKYAELSNARYLFGCSSARVTDPKDIGALMGHLRKAGHVKDEFGITPTISYTVEYDETLTDEMKGLVPSLLRTYFQAGAHVYGRPALDRPFKCIDLLTILDLQNLSPAFKRRYFTHLRSV